MIPADILPVLIITSIAASLVWLAVRAHGRYLERRRHPEPATHGDQGRFPPQLFPESHDHDGDEPAPETGSGERAGDGRPSIYREW